MKPFAAAAAPIRARPGCWFKWGRKVSMEMVCLVDSDFDNYTRLTCLLGRAGNPHTQAGMGASFAQEPWDPVKP